MRGLARVVSAQEAVSLIPSGATIAVSGFVGAGHPELLTATLERHFLDHGSPRDLTLVYAAGQGDRQHRGLNHLAHAGLLKRVVGGHWNLAPKLGKLALENQIEAYNLPQGVICTLYREIAAKRPGVITKVGMNTFIDPIHSGGKMNERTTEALVQRIQLEGEDWLWYRAFPITVGLIRATAADRRGNLLLHREGMIGDVLPIAQAARNHGGIVIAQVQEIVDSVDNPKDVRVPGLLVDFLVVAEEQHHHQTFGEVFNQNYVCGTTQACELQPLEFSERKIIGRRALLEIETGDIVNLGIGLPEAIAAVAFEEGKLGDFTLTVESGPIGGVPASGLSFGCSNGPEAIIDQPSQFDFYDGGGLDIASLGAVEIDREGSVNVTTFGGRFAGVGGFVNISQSAKRLIFCSSFRAGELSVDSDGSHLRIVHDGLHCKFVNRADPICFHGPSAIARGQNVMYVTERAVFRLTPAGVELMEIAPGIDLKSQVLDLMQFRPIINSPRLMPRECFQK